MQPDFTEGRTRIQVLSGDIRTEASDALITAINSEKVWFGGVDGAIQSVAGNQFHAQAAAEDLHDLKTIVATGRNGNRGSFKNVVFVVDDLKSPLRKVIIAGLTTADKAGFETITIPGIRLGVMLGVVEKTMEEAYAELEAGVMIFLKGHRNTKIRNIKFVMWD